METLNVTFYSKEACSLCDEGLSVLQMVAEEIPMKINVVNIYKDDALLELYQIRIPVVAVGEEVIDEGILSYTEMKARLREIAGN